MSKKRLIFDVEETLHSKLKAEAAKQGVPLGALCSSLLEIALHPEGLPRVEDLDQTTIAAMPLGVLREMCQDLADQKPIGWSKSITLVQSEIRRRYRT